MHRFDGAASSEKDRKDLRLWVMGAVDDMRRDDVLYAARDSVKSLVDSSKIFWGDGLTWRSCSREGTAFDFRVFEISDSPNAEIREGTHVDDFAVPFSILNDAAVEATDDILVSEALVCYGTRR